MLTYEEFVTKRNRLKALADEYRETFAKTMAIKESLEASMSDLFRIQRAIDEQGTLIRSMSEVIGELPGSWEIDNLAREMARIYRR